MRGRHAAAVYIGVFIHTALLVCTSEVDIDGLADLQNDDCCPTARSPQIGTQLAVRSMCCMAVLPNPARVARAFAQVLSLGNECRDRTICDCRVITYVHRD